METRFSQAGTGTRQPQFNNDTTDSSISNVKTILDKSQSSVIIREGLLKLLANRPENPIAYLAQFFKSIADESSNSRVVQAVELILVAPHTRHVFNTNLISAFDLLSNGSINQQKDVSASSGITGVLLQELVNELLVSLQQQNNIDLPGPVVDCVQKKLSVRDHEVIDFSLFKSSVFTCILLVEYGVMSEQVYKLLDYDSTDKVSSKLCEAVLNEIKNAMDLNSQQQQSAALRLLSVGSKFKRSNIQKTLIQASSSSSNKTLSEPEFVLNASNLFISQKHKNMTMACS